jgi:hypothetical protein
MVSFVLVRYKTTKYFVFIYQGKALLLLNEDSFKQRSSRSGDILHKALQQHRSMLKSWQCQGKYFNGKNKNQLISFSISISIMEYFYFSFFFIIIIINTSFQYSTTTTSTITYFIISFKCCRCSSTSKCYCLYASSI